jgi:hemerythrin-like domain-containing protein
MTHAIEVLRQEHIGMGRLLRLMQKLWREISAGQSPDYLLLNEISDYLRGYPDQCHHPKEDLIYRKLGDRDPDLQELGGDLEYEHARLTKLTNRFGELLTTAQDDEDVSLDAFITTMDELIRVYRRHMAMEEEHLFPLAIKKLRRADWDEINSAVFEHGDPLTDEASSRYEQIRSEIAELAEEHDERNRLLAGGVLLDQDLASLHSLDQLNELLGSHNYALRLCETRAGGFHLVENENVLLELPPCDEARAAWCAYCYIKGGM